VWNTSYTSGLRTHPCKTPVHTRERTPAYAPAHTHTRIHRHAGRAHPCIVPTHPRTREHARPAVCKQSMTYNIDARAARVLGRDTQSHRVIERPPLHTPSPLDALMESDESLGLECPHAACSCVATVHGIPRSVGTFLIVARLLYNCVVTHENQNRLMCSHLVLRSFKDRSSLSPSPINSFCTFKSPRDSCTFRQRRGRCRL